MKIQNIIEDEDFPPPENARKTQIAGTLPTYVKAKQHLDTHMPTGKTLDFGAGLGGGAAHMGADSYEPFPRPGFEPTYTKVENIPSDTYSRVTNLNVLNVVPKGVRDMIVTNIGRVLAPGGTAIITTRGKDVMSAKGQEGPEAMSRITSIGTYQKGFNTKELMSYVQSILGDGFAVQPLKLGPAGVIVKKLDKATESIIDEVADQPYRFISPVSTSSTQKSIFQTDSGSKMQVVIQTDQHSGVADIGFYDATDAENPTIGMTGKGDAFRVFATVGTIVKQFVDKRKPSTITFSGKASEPGRVKLYDMIARKIGHYLPDYKFVHSGLSNGEKGYMFKRVTEENVDENFADGKGPGRPGDSQRHGIPKHATMAELEKASHASGRKGQLARWQMNMRRGKKHASENLTPIWTPMQLAMMEGGHLIDDLDEDYRDAARFAAQKHKGQTRSGGKPYIGHPVRVANIVKKFKNSKVLDKILSAAFLHDTIEDTDTPEEELRKMFGVLVASLVRELTSDKEEINRVGKTEYLATKMTNMSSWALVIKLADRLDNVSDIKHAKTPEWRHRYRLETETILNRIESDRVLSGTHKRLISLIRRKLQELDEPVTEGLSHKDPVEKWVSTFKKSTHPKFKGKTPEQREKMARIAQYKSVQNKKIGEDIVDVDEALLGTQPSRKERYSRQVRGEKGAGGEVTKTQKAGIINQRHPFQGKLVGGGS